jgi:uncharacterized radical SAM superfamily Fe-S cluster-containing enzyme
MRPTAEPDTPATALHDLEGDAMATSIRKLKRAERDEVFVEYTKSICPLCKVVIDAEVAIRDNRVVMSKRCPDHGRFEALVYSDAQMYMEQQRFNKPGTLPLEFQTEVVEGCPLDCGLCPDHKQHACLGIIEVNTACNLDCPICFADSGHQPDGYSLTEEDVARMLDAFVAAEGEPEVIQFSGGEPTIHKEIVRFIAMAKERGIQVVMLNTNGIRLARDGRFVAELERLAWRSGARTCATRSGGRSTTARRPASASRWSRRSKRV